MGSSPAALHAPWALAWCGWACGAAAGAARRAAWAEAGGRCPAFCVTRSLVCVKKCTGEPKLPEAATPSILVLLENEKSFICLACEERYEIADTQMRDWQALYRHLSTHHQRQAVH